MSSALQGRFALEGRAIPQEMFVAHIAADSIDVNQQYWIQKAIGGPLYRAKVEGLEFLDYPADIAAVPLAIDADRTHQQYKLLTGNTTIAAVEVTQDTASTRRYRLSLSIG